METASARSYRGNLSLEQRLIRHVVPLAWSVVLNQGNARSAQAELSSRPVQRLPCLLF